LITSQEQPLVTSLPPPPLASSAVEKVPCANSGNGGGGGRFDDPYYEPDENSEPQTPNSVDPLSLYRIAALVGMIWILALFATLTIVLESARAHSKHWGPISFPYLLYMDTVILLLSSVTIEFARSLLRSEVSQRCARWLVATVLLGLAFVAGQIAVWQELSSRGLHLASGGASFFFYLITATHALTVVGAIIALVPATFVVSHWRRGSGRQTTLGIVSRYWHFVGALWLCLLMLLVVTVQR
jgi:cytochrome c oxidase subunit III